MRKIFCAVCVLVGMSAMASAPGAPSPSTPPTVVPQRILPSCNAYYPAASAASGTTALSISATSASGIVNIGISKSSGDADLDMAALRCVIDAQWNWRVSVPVPVTSARALVTWFASVAWVHGEVSTLFIGCPYPVISVRLGEEGEVAVSFRILKDGRVSNLAVNRSSGSVDLDNAALACVAQWKYLPVLQNGAPIDLDWRANIDFKQSG